MTARAIQIGDADVIRAGLEVFDRIATEERDTPYERTVARAAVRDMMVRLNLYSAFCLALKDHCAGGGE